MNSKNKRKLKLKPQFIFILKLLAVILIICFSLFMFYRYQLNTLKELGYSEVASKNILRNFEKEYVLSVGENKTLNAAFESSDYNTKYKEKYAKIKYQNHDDLILNINSLLKKGYNTGEVSIILAHGNNEDVTNFAKKDKVKYLEEFYSIDYAKLKYYDRYVMYSDETGEDEETTVLYVNLDLDKENYIDPIIVDKFSTDMLVNKHRKLKENFEPDLTKIDSQYAANDDMEASRIAVNSFIEMYNAAKSENLDLVINSAYRSYDDQVKISETYKNLYGDNYVKNYVAKPGFSEHQTGLAFDIGSRHSNVFAQSNEYLWIKDNAHKYGFILRFSKRYEDVTGFRSEPWHYRYVGKKIATYIYENNITLEEYYVKFLDNN